MCVIVNLWIRLKILQRQEYSDLLWIFKHKDNRRYKNRDMLEKFAFFSGKLDVIVKFCGKTELFKIDI